jgi:hypothetical protein
MSGERRVGGGHPLVVEVPITECDTREGLNSLSTLPNIGRVFGTYEVDSSCIEGERLSRQHNSVYACSDDRACSRVMASFFFF